MTLIKNIVEKNDLLKIICSKKGKQFMGQP